MISRTLYIALFVFSLQNGYAQEYTQYFVNLPGINPAFSGVEDLSDAQVAFRQGWNAFSFKNNSYYFNFNGTARNTYQAVHRNHSLRTSNPEASEKLQSDKGVRRKHGIGAQLAGRNFGPYEKVTIAGNYAFHLPVSRRLDVSFGTKLRFTHERIDFFDFTVRDLSNDQFYQQLMSANTGYQNSFSIDFGSVLYSRNFFLGVSTTNLMARKLGGTAFIETVAPVRMQAQLGWVKPVGPDLVVNPTLLIYGGDYTNARMAGSVRFRYREMFLFGVGIVNASKLSGFLGFAFNNRLSLNYAYDHYLDGLDGFNVNVHELVLKGVLFDKYRVGAKFW